MLTAGMHDSAVIQAR